MGRPVLSSSTLPRSELMNTVPGERIVPSGNRSIGKHAEARCADFRTRSFLGERLSTDNNDAPSLSSATVSIPQSAGWGATQAGGETVSQEAPLESISTAITRTLFTERRARKKFRLATAYNLPGVTPALPGLVTPLITILAFVSTVTRFELRLARSDRSACNTRVSPM